MRRSTVSAVQAFRDWLFQTKTVMDVISAQILQTLNSMQQDLSRQRVDLSCQCCESILWSAQCGAPSIHAIEVLETQTEIVLQAHIPNVVAQTLDIQVTPETIYIAGEQQTLVQGETFYDFESSFHAFKNIVPLPNLVAANTAIAQLNEDTLTVRLQKSGQVRHSVQLQCQDRWESPANAMLTEASDC